jgi:Anti-sigma-28 factor, FlgM
LNPDKYDLKQIPDTDTKKVEALKKVISEGNYTVPSEDLAPKLMESLFRNTILDEDPNGPPGSQLEMGDRAAPKVNGGAMVNQNGSHSASVPSDGAATKRESR